MIDNSLGHPHTGVWVPTSSPPLLLSTSRRSWEYCRRLAELDDQLDAAAIRGDTKRQAERSAERDALIAELKRATGLGGRSRRSGSPTEKARLNVTRTVRHAINELRTRAPDLAAHLDQSIVTGVSCCYEPAVDIAWTT